MNAFLSRLLIFLFPGIPSPRRQARKLLRAQGSREAACEEALVQLRFAEDYGAPGDEAYWLAVLRALEKTGRR